MKNKHKARLTEDRLFLMEKFGPLLFFLLPLVMLIIGGKSWVKYVGVLCQVIAVSYIVAFYYTQKRYLSYQPENRAQIKVPCRFYRIAWIFTVFVVCFEIAFFFMREWVR